MADNNEEGRVNVDSFDFANEGASEETPMLVNYLITRLQQAMANPAVQGEVQQQLQAYGFIPPHQEERIPEKSLGETSKRGTSKCVKRHTTGYSVSTRMMNAKEILDHFAQRLARLEVSGVLPAAEAVLRLPSPPLDLHSFTSSYQGTPVLFPASWAPTSSPLSLTDLLRDSLQVEVFRLQYKQTDEPWHLEEEENESSTLWRARKSQLLYLTWRSLPELSIPGSMPEEFCHFIDNIIRPITTPRFIASETVKQRNVWMGSLVTSRIHFDALDNLHVCLSGGKIVHLYPPSELPNMYPEPWNEGWC
ncbi:hypothetical protein L7F22_023299 [Adiantum nelumboides]|nr:hypothetical protein [Adiantum nelumboides]